ncbi:MAG: phosphotransferase [Sedimentisphaerales bacterium]|nr:phosphotransferase [Sedimentisphaerales bacterium]
MSHYDVGVVHRVRPLSAGNRRAPKVIVHADKGTFLLKRRPRGREDMARVVFAHAVQRHLALQSFPVTNLLTVTRPSASGAGADNKTILTIDNHIYELFKFVTGSRYDVSLEATFEAGRQLAVLHKALRSFSPEYEPLMDSFHDSSTVRQHLRMIRRDHRSGPVRLMEAVSNSLLIRYDKSSERINRLGFNTWKRQVVHGDWHPGNLLFVDRKIVGVVDFDSIRIAPPVTDLANGMLQFSIIGDHPDPNFWPDHFDEGRLMHFLNGYRDLTAVSKRQLNALVDLMIETMIAEAVLPVAATGFFGHLSGLAFLRMILRKTKWLRHHRAELTEATLR